MSTSLRLTVAEYDRMVRSGAFATLGRRVELIRGELTEVTPAGPMHDDLLVYLMNWSFRVIDPATTLVSSQTGLQLLELASRPEPDVMWLRAARYHDSHPSASDVRLAIEVADTSLKTDLEDKAKLYADAAIAEYWVVDAANLRVLVHRDPRPGRYQMRQVALPGQRIAPLCRPTAILQLDELFDQPWSGS